MACDNLACEQTAGAKIFGGSKRMNDGSFQKMDQPGEQLYGPKGVVVCGYEAAEHGSIATALEKMGLGDRPIIFASGADLTRKLKEVLASGDCSGMGENAPMPRAIIMSGFTQKEVQFLMSVYRQAELPRQLWATLTPVSEEWTLDALLQELAAEADALNNGEK